VVAGAFFVLPLFEIAIVLVCFDHVASGIVNADHDAIGGGVDASGALA